MDAESKEVLVDELGRRSYTTSIAFGPTIGKNIALAYLPHENAKKGNKFVIDYMGEEFPVTVADRPLWAAHAASRFPMKHLVRGFRVGGLLPSFGSPNARGLPLARGGYDGSFYRQT